ncbi:helix-turn-helix domain-containing protein [uncultured Jatrophihabitans sp.]|uniref:helix-turn-helix domain-containing protein n=1 Tax=uncultured Jatrophihabitans sp. TaxID=1610747 RepID=UPI0035CAAE1A
MPDVVVTTDSVDSRDREALWRSVLSDTLAPIQLDGWAEPSEPTAVLRSTARGRLLFLEHEATAHIHRRTPALIKQSDAAYFQVAILTAGSASLQQDDRVATLGPGDAVLYENSRPFTWTPPEPWAATALCIPVDAVRLTEVERRRMSAQRLSGGSGLTGVVSRFVLDITQHASQIAEANAEHILAHATDLVVSLLATPTNPQRGDARHRILRDRIKSYIDTHLRDPALTPDQIAAAANISTRYLHKLFEDEHETVALYLRRRRLHCARNELLDPRSARHSIAAIAHHCGFSDLSGFNRAFKTTFGLTPRELRATQP